MACLLCGGTAIAGTHTSSTAIALTGGPNPSFYGQSLVFTATVTGDGVHGAPTGAVGFTNNGVSIDPSCDYVSLFTISTNDATAICVTTLLPVGTHAAIVATYFGNITYTISSGTLSPAQTVSPVATEFRSLAPSAAITYGTNSITVSGIITAFGYLYPPSGETVTITINGNRQPATIGANGIFRTSFPTATIPASTTPYTIKYDYAGDSNFTSATDSSTTLTVNRATPVFSNLTPSQSITYGTPTIALSGRVAAGPVYPPAGETVTITINGTTVLATIVSNGSFTTAFPTAPIPVSTTPYTIKYDYPDDSNFKPATDSTTTLTVNAKATPVFSGLTPSQSINFGTSTITLSGIIGAPGPVYPPAGETVSITVNGNTVNGLIGVNGHLTTAFSTGTIPASTTPYPIKYDYPGDSNFKAATDSTTTLTVKKAITTTTVTSSLNPSPLNQPITLTATVTVTGQLGGTASGTASFTDNGNSLLGCMAVQLTNRQARCTTSSLTEGTHTITATYSGNGNFTGSSGTTQQLIGNAIPAVIVTPTLGPPTTTVLVSGGGFDPYAAVDIYFDTTDLALATTNGSGVFGLVAGNLQSGISLQVPASGVPGTHWVTAVERSSAKAAQTSFLVRTDWAQFRFEPRLRGMNPYENVLSPATVGSIDLHWSYQTDAHIYTSSPTVANGVVYFGSNDGNLYAANASTGAMLWIYRTGSIYGIFTSPAVAKEVVYFGSDDGNLYALNASTGALLWKSETYDYYSSPTVANGVVYFGSGDHNLYALNARTGAVLWKYTTGYGIVSSPTVADGVVYIGSYDDNLYALNANTGAVLWKYATTGYVISSSPAVANGVLYLPSTDSNVYALNASTGVLLWKYKMTTGTNSSVAVANGVVYAASYDGNVYALNASTGALLWSYTTGGKIQISSPAVANGVVYIGSYDGSLYALGVSTGVALWKYTTADVIYSSPTVANGMVYVTSYDGKIYAFDLTGGLYADKLSPPEHPDPDLLRPDWTLQPSAPVTKVTSAPWL